MPKNAAAYTKETAGYLLAQADRCSLPESPCNYPPIGSWGRLRNRGGLLKAWKESLRAYGQRPVVYVHVPFCETLCRFCGFYKIKMDPVLRVSGYLSALAREAAIYGPAFKNSPLRFLCVGGGTPSIMNAGELARFFDILRGSFNVAPDTRIAFEASPNTLAPDKLRVLKRAGVEFLAIGVQSLDAGLLAGLNRFQRREQVFRAVRAARKAGIEQVEVDLMVGLPGQTAEGFLDDVRRIARLDLERIYIFDFQPKQLTTVAAVGRGGALPGAALEAARALRREAMDILTASGYTMACGHWVYKRNGHKWPYSYDQGEEGSYSILGLGPNAISYAIGRARYQNLQSEDAWEKVLARGGLPVEKGCRLTKKDEMRNYVIMSALHRGQVDTADFRRRFSLNISGVFPAELKRLGREGILLQSGGLLVVLNREKAVLEMRRELYAPEIFARLAEKYPVPAPLGAAARQPGHREGYPFDRLDKRTCECSLTGAGWADLSPRALERPARAPAEVIQELFLARSGGRTEALLTGLRRADLSLAGAAASAALRLGFARLSALAPAGVLSEGVCARLKDHGFSAVLPVCVTGAAAARACSAASAAGLEVRPVIILDGSAGDVPVLLGALAGAGARRARLVFPRFPDAPGGKPAGAVTGYGGLPRLAAAVSELAERTGLDVKFMNLPLCALGRHWRLAADRLGPEDAAGDAKESASDREVIKLRECRRCRFLLTCAGPVSDHVRLWGCGGIAPV